MDRVALGLVMELPDLRVRALRDGSAVQADVVARYAELLGEGVEFPPILVMRVAVGVAQVAVLDGRHRLEAHRIAGRADIAVTFADCVDLAAGQRVAVMANVAHGLQPSSGDLRRCIELAIPLWPLESDRVLAARLGCGKSWVSRVRLELTRPPEVSAGVDAIDTGVTETAAPEVDPQQIILEPYQTAYTLELPVSQEEDTREFRLGVDPGRIDPGPRVVTHTLKLEGGDEDGLSWSFIKPGEIRPVVDPPVVKEDAAPKAYRGRDALERWYTDPVLTAVCWRWLVDLDVLPEREVWTVLEPAVGDGAWVRGAAVVGLERKGLERLPKIAWESCDLDGVAQRPSELRARGVVGDFLEVSWPDAFDLVITNPPNSKAFEFVRRALELVVPGGVVAFLMPLSWYAAQGRRTWLEEHPPYRVGVCPWRPSFGGPAAALQGTGNGTPTQVYAMFVWMEGYQGETVLEIIPGGEVNSGEE